MKRLLSLLLVGLCLPLTAQTYYLPKTAVRFHLLIEKQTYTPGEFARYAKRYLQLDHVEQQEQVTQRVIRCEVSTLGLRDSSKCYTLQLKGKGEAADVRLSDDGVLLSINDTPQEAHVGTGVFKAAAAASVRASYQSFMNAEALAAGSVAKKAELTAQQIVELRERRLLLATGEADEMPQDERQLQLMLNEIDNHCQQLTALFTGTTRRDTTEQTVMLCPMKEVEREVVFRLSHKRGLVDKDDLSGVPFYMTLKQTEPSAPLVVEKKKDDGVYVNVPARMSLTLQQEDQTLATFQVPMAQFGYVDWRDGASFKRYVTHLILNPATGAVVKQFSETVDK